MSDQVQWIVRVRIPRANAWPSPPMTRSEAISAAASLRNLIRAEGDGAGFIEFEAAGGRMIHIRAREVLSVEADQWRSRAAAESGPTEGVTVTIDAGPAAPGEATEFLRRQAQRSPQ